MTSKNLFFNLMKEDLKRRLWAVALTFLTFFFALPVATALSLSGSRNMEETYYGLMYGARSILGFQNGFIAVIIVLLSLILGGGYQLFLAAFQKKSGFLPLDSGKA